MTGVQTCALPIFADNVGDNVGDCAGMAADLFESYAVTLVASLILGKAAFGDSGLVYPLLVPGIGIITAILGIFLTRLRSTDRSAMSAINRSFYISALVSALLVGLATYTYLPDSFATLTGVGDTLKNSLNVEVVRRLKQVERVANAAARGVFPVP